MHTRSISLLLAFALPGFGCSHTVPKDLVFDDQSPDPDDTGTPPTPEELVLETTRGPISADNLEFAVFPGLVGVPNLDDDDEDGAPDWSQIGLASGDNDFSLANLSTNGNEIELSLDGPGIRIYQDEGLILGEGTAEEFSVPIDMESLALRVEFSDFMVQGTLVVRDLTLGSEFEVSLTSSPLLFNHHLQPAEKTVAARGFDNEDFIASFEDALGDAFFSINASTYAYDVWLQDEFEFGYATSPDVHLNVIFDTPRNRGLDDFPEDRYQRPDWLIVYLDNEEDSISTYDSAGNLEVSPPVTVDGTAYPYGRIYYGGVTDTNEGPSMATQNALASFKIQRPFAVDSSWLCVGHVSEFSSTIPDPSAPKGFRLVFSNTDLAWTLLETAGAFTMLPKYFETYPYVGSLLEDGELRELNVEYQSRLDEQEDIFRAELGLGDEDIVYVPGLFTNNSDCGGYPSPLFPSMANLVVANSGEQTIVFLSDPFLRTDESDQEADPFIAETRARMPNSLELIFLDDWVYHENLGNLHSGTNVKRTAPRTWWEDGGHLLTDD
jgi:hypothetical protein